MPIFECSSCHVADNTAVTNFAWRHHNNEPALCSQCDPDIGKWHGWFERKQASEFNPIEIDYPIVDGKTVDRFMQNVAARNARDRKRK